MGGLRQQSETTITVERNIDDVFQAMVNAGHGVGQVKEARRITGYVVIGIGMGLFQNPATVRVSLRRLNDWQTQIALESDSFDGVIGFGSAGKAIDQIIEALDAELDSMYIAPKPPTADGRCTVCGTCNPVEFNFCGNCGATLVSLQTNNEEIRCARCGVANPAGSRFCEGCGIPFFKPTGNQ